MQETFLFRWCWWISQQFNIVIDHLNNLSLLILHSSYNNPYLIQHYWTAFKFVNIIHISTIDKSIKIKILEITPTLLLVAGFLYTRLDKFKNVQKNLDRVLGAIWTILVVYDFIPDLYIFYLAFMTIVLLIKIYYICKKINNNNLLLFIQAITNIMMIFVSLDSRFLILEVLILLGLITLFFLDPAFNNLIN